MEKTKPTKPPSKNSEAFTKALIAVPKKEIDEQKAKYEKQKASKKRKAA